MEENIITSEAIKHVLGGDRGLGTGDILSLTESTSQLRLALSGALNSGKGQQGQYKAVYI